MSRLPPNAARAWDWWPDLSLPGYKGLVPSPQHTGAVMLEKLSVCTATRRPPDQNGHQQRRPGSARRAEGGGRSATGERTDATLPGLVVNPGPVCSDEEAGPARATLVPLPPATLQEASPGLCLFTTCSLLCPRLSSRQLHCFGDPLAAGPFTRPHTQGLGRQLPQGCPWRVTLPRVPAGQLRSPWGSWARSFRASVSPSLPISSRGASDLLATTSWCSTATLCPCLWGALPPHNPQQGPVAHL